MSALVPTYIGEFVSSAAATTFVQTTGWIPANPGSAAHTYNLVAGLTYRNSTDGLFYIHTGSAWQSLSGGGSGDAALLVTPVENITSATLMGAPASLSCAVHRITTPGTVSGTDTNITLADGTEVGQRHKFTVIAVGHADDQLKVYMTMVGVNTQLAFTNPVSVFDGFEVVWGGTVWDPMWREDCVPSHDGE